MVIELSAKRGNVPYLVKMGALKKLNLAVFSARDGAARARRGSSSGAIIHVDVKICTSCFATRD